MKAPYSLRRLTAYFLKLGAIGFGDPVALVGYVRRDLLEERKWISEEDNDVGLAQLSLGRLGPIAKTVRSALGGYTVRSQRDPWKVAPESEPSSGRPQLNIIRTIERGASSLLLAPPARSSPALSQYAD